jgi:hypothetical protein
LQHLIKVYKVFPKKQQNDVDLNKIFLRYAFFISQQKIGCVKKSIILHNFN